MRALAVAGLPVAVRIHQEGLVEAFARDPRRKCEADQGPGVRTIADLLRGAADQASVERFVRAVIANPVIGAPDAHGKNCGLLLVGTNATFAPLYDVATGLIPNAAGRVRWTKGAMSIGGERGFGDVERGNWEKFAPVAGLAPEQVLDRVDELATSIPPAFEQAANEVVAPDAGFLAGAVAKNVAAVAEQTRKGLTSTRRTGGRLVTPFLRTLPGQGRSAGDGQSRCRGNVISSVFSKPCSFANAV